MLKGFYSRNRGYFRFISFFLLIVIILFIITSPVIWFYDNHVKARSFLMDAKNIQLSMRLLNIQYYGNDRNIYQPGTENGMSKDTLEEIQLLSYTNGEIILICWDYEDNLPGKFYYKTEDFLAIYEYDTNRKEPTWEVLRLNEIINFGKD